MAGISAVINGTLIITAIYKEYLDGKTNQLDVFRSKFVDNITIACPKPSPLLTLSTLLVILDTN